MWWMLAFTHRVKSKNVANLKTNYTHYLTRDNEEECGELLCTFLNLSNKTYVQRTRTYDKNATLFILSKDLHQPPTMLLVGCHLYLEEL